PEAWSLRRPIDPGWTPRGAIVPDDRGYRGAIVPDDRGHRAGVAAGKSELLAHQGVERRRVLPTDQPPGFGAAPIRTLEPTGSSRLSRPSADRSPSSSPTTLRVTRSLADRTSDRSNTMCAATGVTIRQRRVGVTMGPPAEKE